MITRRPKKRDASNASRRAMPQAVPEPVEWALGALLDSLELARDAGHSCWDFAVEVGTLQAAGLRNSELRWLACKSLVEHARETTELTADNRSFETTGLLNLTSKTCFVLTASGEELARTLRPGASSEPTQVAPQRESGQSASDEKPFWDVDRYELRWQGKLVKKYTVPSPNQRKVLLAFEEEGWPCRVDDPLPPHPELDPKRRLHDTIKSLNRHQEQRLLKFLGDGTGEGVRWEPI